MKKTIAKIMAAAMILSAVPAVAVPTLTAEAAEVKVSISNVPTATKALGDGGNTGVNLTSESSVTATKLGLAAFWSDADQTKAANKLNVTFSFDDDGDIYVVASDSIASEVGIRINKGTNIIDVYANWNGTADGIEFVSVMNNASTPVAIEAGSDGSYDLGAYFIGGTKDEIANQTIKENVNDASGLLNSGDVYAKVDLSAGTAEILAGAGTLDDNDDLRGETLNLTTVEINGATYAVTKFGGQALKEAHMKKLEAENLKKIGKGSMRKCKQLKKADIEDGQKVRKIHAKAFYDCKNLNTIVIDGRKLNTVGKDAFHGVKKNCTIKIKAKKSKFESDKKMILKNGGNKNLKFVRK